MKQTLQKLSTFLMAMAISGSLLAQVPQKFNYQGIARDTKGNPMAQQRMTLKLSVLPTSDATEGEYEEIQSVTTNEFGLYTLQIGNGTPLKDEMKAVKWETGNKYIKVAIDPKGGNDFVDAGTTQLLSVPYAIYADKAGMAKTTAGSDRAGTVSTSAAGTGTVNFLTKFTAANTIYNSQLFDNGTNVGIGTTTPLAKFHILQNVVGSQEHVRMQNLSPTGAGRFTMYNDTATSYATFSKYGNNYAGGYTGIPSLYPFANLLAFGNNGKAANDGLGRFLISSGGSVGISMFKGGTSKLKFHADYATENVGIGGNAAPASRVHLNNTDGTSMDLRLTNTTTGHTATDGLTLTQSGANTSILNRENGFMTIGTNNAEQFRITSAGNVGIGTIAPTAKLDVNGQVKISGGAPGTGKVLTSDASGLATWQNSTSSSLTIENGLTKKNDTISLGGRLNVNTTISQDGRSFTLSDTTGTSSPLISQLLYTGSSPLSATARTQTFSIPVSRLLQSIKVRLTGIASTSVTLELKNAQGFVLGSQTISFSGLYDSLVNFSFPSKPLLQAGVVYNISVSGTTGSNWFLSSGNPFAGGVASTNATEDFTFQVNAMDEGVAFVSSATKIGIGTATPTAKLDVNGNIRIQGGNPGVGKVLTSDATGLATWQTPSGGGTGFFQVSPANASHIRYTSAANYGKNFLVNTDSVNYDGSGPDAKMMFIPSKLAFRAGGIDNTNWNMDSIGFFSVSFGSNTKAIGDYAVALGSNSTASGEVSTAMGFTNTASGFASTAMGQATTASGTASTAIGNFTNAPGFASTAMGQTTTASGIYSTAIGNQSTASGNGSMAMGQATTASGTVSTAMGNFTTASGNRSTAMGDQTRAKSLSETAIGSWNDTLVVTNATTWAGDSNRLFTIGNGTAANARSTAFVVQQNGNVGIGVRVPSAKLSVNGTAEKPGGGSWTALSDRRLKNNIVPYQDGLNTLLKINPVKFHYNEKAGCDTKPEYVGVIAQELNEIAPYMVGHFQKDQTDYLNVDNSAMTYMLINAVKELSSKLESQQEIIEKLSKQVEELSTK